MILLREDLTRPPSRRGIGTIQETMILPRHNPTIFRSSKVYEYRVVGPDRAHTLPVVRDGISMGFVRDFSEIISKQFDRLAVDDVSGVHRGRGRRKRRGPLLVQLEVGP